MSALAKMFSVEGPFATVYLAPKAATEAATAELALRLRAIREQLRDQGADEATVDAVDRAMAGLDPSSSRAVFAAGGLVLYEQRVAGHVDDLGWWRSLPYLLPLFTAAQLQLPYVLVLTDRTGADVLAYSGEGDPVLAGEITGSHDEIRRVAAGGWSQPRYQHRAEDSWEGNAREVADQVGRVAADVGARLLFVGGDVRAVQFLCEHLPAHVQPLVQVLDEGGGRATDGSDEIVAKVVRQRAAAAATAELAAVLARFQEERGQHDRAASGVLPTIEAFQQARVDTLLIHDDPADRRTAWFGTEPTSLALDPGSLLGTELIEGRLADVFVRAALGTSAAVRVVPAGRELPDEGVGALLRWS